MGSNMSVIMTRKSLIASIKLFAVSALNSRLYSLLFTPVY